MPEGEFKVPEFPAYAKGRTCGRKHHDWKVTVSKATHYVARCTKCGSSKVVKAKFRAEEPKTFKCVRCDFVTTDRENFKTHIFMSGHDREAPA